MTKITDWAGCYDESWGNDITALSYSHPAKMARGLVKKIYSYILEQNWLQPGDVVVDPFAGIGGTALDAVTNDINWIGVELEQRFVDLGAGCDCTGISKADWIRFYGRWDRANYKDGRHWCPACLAQAKQIDESPAVQFGLFGPPEPTATYKRNSGRIPFTTAHRYQGNIDLFHKRPEAKGRAVLLQGDSRRLAAVISEAGGVVGSPPFAESLSSGSFSEAAIEELRQKGHKPGPAGNAASYGTTPGQLGAMPEGRAIVSSPPYAAGTVHGGNGIDQGKLTGNTPGRNSQVKAEGYGDSTGQLSNLPTGDPETVINTPTCWTGQINTAVVSSPPWAGNSGGRGEASRNGIDPALFDRHQGGMVGGIGGPGNLAGMEPGEVEAVIDGLVSSPPYANGTVHGGSSIDHSKRLRASRRSNELLDTFDNYGESEGQLANEQPDTFWAAAKQILLQCAAILPPGAPAVWVVKGFVRSGQIVDFPGQWQALCEACGFETVEIVRAWLVKDKGTQFDLEGNGVKRTVKRASFFRRLHEQRRPDLAIDYEIVLFTRRVSQ